VAKALGDISFSHLPLLSHPRGLFRPGIFKVRSFFDQPSIRHMEREKNFQMRILTLSAFPTIIIDVCVWFLLHMGISKWLTTWDPKQFNPKSWLYREGGWEGGGRIYKKVFLVHIWKKWLPDAAPWFKGGFAKNGLASLSRSFLERFIIETCRGELTHWISMGIAPIFFLWNAPWVGCLMLIYAVTANLPCIIAQRYNRIRFSHLLNESSKR